MSSSSCLAPGNISEPFYGLRSLERPEGKGLVSRVLIEDLMMEQRPALLGLNEPRMQEAEGQ
jgi:hypothetical protein